jgi:hypothetical protein
MRRSTILILAATALAVLAAAVAAGRQWLRPPKPAAPPAPVQYQYTTIRWPEGTQSALYDFRAGDRFTNNGDILCRRGTLDTILVRARQASGFDFFAAAGDTIILRRVAPASPYDPAAGLTNLWIVPNPPEEWRWGSDDSLQIISSQNSTH